MTRIIGGEAGGRRLRTPPGDATRPTSDRVREALFSALESALGTLAGHRFLDLYAGSGAVGLEARSRGAERVTLVEQDRRTARVVEGNARDLGYTQDGSVTVVAQPVHRFLTSRAAEVFDVVFADPPYPMESDALVDDLFALVQNGWIGRGAIVICERSARSVEPDWPAGLVRERRKNYGETALWFVRAELPEGDRGDDK